MRPHRGGDVGRTGRVRGHVRLFVSGGGLPRRVNDRGRALDERGERRGVAHVALHELGARAFQPRHVVRATHERPHTEAGGEECVRDVAADEARAPGQRDEVALAHRATLSQG